MTGPATEVFEGEVDLDELEAKLRLHGVLQGPSAHARSAGATHA
jgi:hypothetical protein